MRCPGDRTGVIKERVLGEARDGSVIERQDRGSQSGRRNSEGFRLGSARLRPRMVRGRRVRARWSSRFEMTSSKLHSSVAASDRLDSGARVRIRTLGLASSRRTAFAQGRHEHSSTRVRALLRTVREIRTSLNRNGQTPLRATRATTTRSSPLLGRHRPQRRDRPTVRVSVTSPATAGRTSPGGSHSRWMMTRRSWPGRRD